MHIIIKPRAFYFALECAFHGANGETMGIKVLIHLHVGVLERIYRICDIVTVIGWLIFN